MLHLGCKLIVSLPQLLVVLNAVLNLLLHLVDHCLSHLLLGVVRRRTVLLIRLWSMLEVCLLLLSGSMWLFDLSVERCRRLQLRLWLVLNYELRLGSQRLVLLCNWLDELLWHSLLARLHLLLGLKRRLLLLSDWLLCLVVCHLGLKLQFS